MTNRFVLLLVVLLAGCAEETKTPDKTPYLVPFEAYKLSHVHVVEFHTARGDYCVSSSNGLACDWSKDHD